MRICSLRSQKDFNNVSKSAFKRRGSCFMILVSNHYKPQENFINSSDEAFCFGMKVGKKISKKAVVRNKIKRRIRHIMRLITKDPSFFAKAAIVIPYKDFDNIEFAKILSEFKGILNSSK